MENMNEGVGVESMGVEVVLPEVAEPEVKPQIAVVPNMIVLIDGEEFVEVMCEGKVILVRL